MKNTEKRRAAAKQKRENTAKILVRQLTVEDYDAVVVLQQRCYPGMGSWTREQWISQVTTFPEGQIGIDLDGRLVANSATLIVDMEELGLPHTYKQVTDSGFIRNHDPDGDSLYGIEISVDPEHRGLRLARRLYDARKSLARSWNLRRIIIGGRMPRYHRYADRMSPEQYVSKVISKEIRDPGVTAQISNGFSVQAILKDYLPGDLESRGHALLMEWLNTSYVPRTGLRPGTGRIRVASVQYKVRPVSSFDDFAKHCEFFIDTAGDYHCDFVIFPEILTEQLLSLVHADRPGEAARGLDQFTERYIEFFRDAAIKYCVNIIAGSHMVVEEGKLYNVAFLFHRDGHVSRQRKLHITPAEERWWGTSPGSQLEVFDTDRVKVAILICYDVEFPELARIAASKGAKILFVPFNTDIRPAYVRVRYCAHARCIENHVYTVLSGVCGNLPSVEGADIHYAQSVILTPSDIPFSRDGICAEATPNVETMLVHDLDLDVLRRTRRNGTVRPWTDRRTDLYQVCYSEDGQIRKA
jgi:predicted amidohydrolase/ribosomal protein S18 acetylase RimI-like enzyme